jgi:hypothetical protein
MDIGHMRMTLCRDRKVVVDSICVLVVQIDVIVTRHDGKH